MSNFIFVLTLLIIFLQAFISEALKRHPEFITNALIDTEGETYVHNLLFRAVIHLVNEDEPITSDNCPETLLLDLHRMRTIQNERHDPNYRSSEQLLCISRLAFIRVNASVHMERYQIMITKAWIMQ